jgi:hypothetical protein
VRDVLRRQFGDERVFYDVTTIQGGVDFSVAIRDAIAKASVVVLVIGPHWSRRRLLDRLTRQPDWVRVEIEYARQLAKPILPILVAGGAMPNARTLHSSVRFLSTIHAVPLRDDSWDNDVAQLLNRVSAVASSPVTQAPVMAAPPSRATRYGLVAAVIIVAVVGAWLTQSLRSRGTLAPESRSVGPSSTTTTTLPPPPRRTTTPPPPRELPKLEEARPPQTAKAAAPNRPPTTGKIEIVPYYNEGLVSATKFVFTAKDISDPDGDPLKYIWDFGDGSPPPKSAASVTKTYDRVNRFDVKLFVNDGKLSEDMLAAEAQVTVRDVTGTWILTLVRDPKAAVALPTKFTINLTQQGNTLSGRIIPDGTNRPTLLTGWVEHPNRVYFGSESAWWNDDSDAYFDLQLGSLAFQMSSPNGKRCGTQLPCLSASARRQ